MPNVSLTGIEFTIKGSADKASASVDSLIQKLSNLNAALSNGANAKAFAKGLEGIAKAANSLSGTNIAGAQSALKQLSKSMESFKSFGDSLKGAATFGNAMSKLAANPENLIQVAEILAKIATIDFTNIKEAGDGLRNIAAASNAIAKIPQETKKVGDAAKKANTPLKNFIASLKRIAFYRILRGIIKSVTQAFQEGLKNAYQFSKTTGGDLAQALDSLATKSLTMKNQLGAAFGALITAIAPVVIQVINLVTKLAEAITRLIAILGGSNTWLRAKENWTEWGEAAAGAGGAAKEALKYLAPFDELNVLPSESGGGGGGGTNFGDMFEYVSTEEGSGFLDALISAFSGLSDWFQSKDWQDIGAQAWQTLKDVFTDGTAANEAVTSFMEALGSAFGAVVGTAWGFITSLVDDLIAQFKSNLKDYNGDGKLDAVDFLKAVLKTGGDVVSWVYDTLVKPFFDGFGRALTGDNDFDFTEWATENLVNPLIRAWNTFTQNMINPMIGAINNFIDFVNERFNTDIPHIPLVGEIKTLEDKVPERKHYIGNGKYIVTTVKDSVPTKDKVIEKTTADVTKVKDDIPKSKKNIPLFRADVTSFNDKMKSTAKKFTGFSAGISSIKDEVDAKKKKLDSMAAVLKYQQDGLTKTQKYLDGFTAKVTKVKREIPKADTVFESTAKFTNSYKAYLTKKQKTIETNALFSDSKDGLTKNEKTIDTKANFNSVKNSLGTVKFDSTAWFKKKILDVGLDDGYGNITLNATARITRVTGTETTFNGISIGDGQLSGNSYSQNISVSANDSEEVLYRAFSRALADSDLGGDIELDGNTLFRAMVTRNRQNTRLTGVNAFA